MTDYNKIANVVAIMSLFKVAKLLVVISLITMMISVVVLTLSAMVAHWQENNRGTKMDDNLSNFVETYEFLDQSWGR
jgi:hypothetical protein